MAHETAKLLLAQTIRENADRGLTIALRTRCTECEEHAWTEIPPGTFTSAVVECRLEDYRCDVVAFGRDGEARLALEVLVTHAIPEEKSVELSCSWVELDAESVIASPVHWDPVRSHLRSTTCNSCRQKGQRLRRMVQQAGLGKSDYSLISTPATSGYVAAEMECYRCAKPMPVFWWPGVPFCERPPQTPRPRTIQLRRSKRYGGRYWMNTCLHCGATQGDNFVFFGFGGKSAPLSRLPHRELPSRQHAPGNDPMRATIWRLFGR